MNKERAFLEISNKRAWLHVSLRFLWHAFAIYAFYVAVEKEYYFFALLTFYLHSMTWTFLAYAGLAHELFHKRVFSSKPINAFLYKLCSYLTWSNPAYFSKSHLYHHTNTFDEGDVEPQSCFDASFWNLFALNTINFPQLFRRLLYTVSNAAGKEYLGKEGVIFCQIEASRKEIVHEARLMLLVNICFYLFLLAAFNMITALAVFLGGFTATFLNRVLAASQHQGLEDLKEQGPFYHSRTMFLPKVVEFFYANMNYHAEHHYKASVPFYNLPAFHAHLSSQGLIQRASFKDYFNQYILQK